MPTPLIYRTVTMLAAIQAMPTHRTFLRDGIQIQCKRRTH